MRVVVGVVLVYLASVALGDVVPVKPSPGCCSSAR
jgi:hypothetical protein